MALDVLVAPAHLWVPPHTSSSGGEAADFAESLGIIVDGEQRLALDVILAERPDGRWAAFEAAVIAARQNLKTFLFEVIVLADLFVFDAELVVWTAHLFPTAMEAFRDMRELVTNYDHLRRRVRTVTEGNGSEGIELMSGQRLLFKARSKSAGRGLTGDRVVLDEAFHLSGSEMGALLPTLSARPNPQVLYGSSAGHALSAVLRGIRDRGRAGGDPSLAYIEWCAPVVGCADDRCTHRPPFEGCALDNVDAWHQANPALGRRISLEHVEAERRALPPEEFARERLGWWDEPTGATTGVPLELWESCATATGAGEPMAFAVDVTPDFSWSSVAQALVGPAGTIVEVVAHRRGTDWVAPMVKTLLAGRVLPVALDAGGPASVILDDFELAGVALTLMSARDAAQACGSLVDGLIRRSFMHLSQPELDAAVMGASRRPLGDAWAWSRKTSAADISPLVAVTFALWARQAVVDVSLSVW